VRIHDVLRPETMLELTLAAGPWDARTVERVRVVGDLAEIANGRRGELAVLTRRASRLAAGRRALLDLLESAGRREHAAVALYGLATTSPAAIDGASRARVALLAIPAGRDPAELALAVERVLRRDPDAVLRRLLAAQSAIEYARPAGTEAVLQAAGAALDADVRFATVAPAAARAEAVEAGGRRIGYVWADREDAAVGIACRLCADAIVRAGAPAVPEVGDEPNGVLRTVVVEPAAGDADLVMLEALRLAERYRWRASRAGTVVVLVGNGDPAGLLLERVAERLPEAEVLCGVSREHSAHRSAAAATEARVAVERARSTGAVNRPVTFDGTDAGRLAREAAASEAGRAAAATLLAPLEGLDDERAAQAVRTLRVYLDNWGSLQRSGRVLHLHPNAVAQRMRRIRALLPADLDDPEQRVSLQIACRAWEAGLQQEP
jgi:PucR C-terminal helix-turn-helix domain